MCLLRSNRTFQSIAFACVLFAGREATAATVLYGTVPQLTSSLASFADAGRPQFTADDFIFATGQDYAITQVRWWGRYFEAGNVSAITSDGLDNFYLQFYLDTGTGPETAPWIEIAMGAAARTPVAEPGGVPVFEFNHTLVNPVVLPGGTRHFLSIVHDNNIDDPQFAWLWATPSSFSDPRWWRTDTDAPWRATGFNTAFELIGRPIPEPATAALLGMSLLGMAVRRRFSY
jgi:hypothetical protein